MFRDSNLVIWKSIEILPDKHKEVGARTLLLDATPCLDRLDVSKQMFLALL